MRCTELRLHEREATQYIQGNEESPIDAIEMLNKKKFLNVICKTMPHEVLVEFAVQSM